MAAPNTNIPISFVMLYRHQSMIQIMPRKQPAAIPITKILLKSRFVVTHFEALSRASTFL